MGMIRNWGWPRSSVIAAPMLLIAVCGTPVIFAQSQVLPAAAVAAAGTETDSNSVRLLVGRSAIVDVGSAIARVSLTSPDIADAMVTSPSQLLVNGKIPGTISMFVWDRGGALRRYEVTVQRDLAQLAAQVRQLFPGEKIEVQSNGKNIVLSGTVSSKDVIEKAVNVATGYVGSRDEVVTLLQLQANAPSNQVMLRVRFAEVSRSALTELGASIFTSPLGIENNIGRITTQQFAAPGFEDLGSAKSGNDWQKFGHPVDSADGKLTFSDFLNFFLFNEKYDLGAMVRALQNRGLFQSLAEPNLVAESGKEASFLAGGEFPIPVAQGSGANLAVSVVFKEFGVRLSFTPTVNGNRVHLKVKPEVSTLDFANGVVLQGFRIPALTTRRTETELELNNGQTFAIAGLMNNTVSTTMSKVPGIGDIPILGYLFRSKAAQKNQTELVVMITPVILANNSAGVTETLPSGTESFIDPIPANKVKPMPAPAFTPERDGVNAAPAAQTPVASAPAARPAPQAASKPNAAAAAAAVSALAPGAPRPVDPAPAPASASSAPSAERRVTAQEKKAIERARQQEAAQAKEREKQERREKAAEVKRQTAQILADRRQAEAEKAAGEKQSREQARRDGEAARRAQEAARKQAIKDREQQKAVEDAAERLKIAEDLYHAEVAKKNTP